MSVARVWCPEVFAGLALGLLLDRRDWRTWGVVLVISICISWERWRKP